MFAQGSTQKGENGCILPEKSKEKLNRSVEISARIEKMTFFFNFSKLGFVNSIPPPLSGSRKKTVCVFSACSPGLFLFFLLFFVERQKNKLFVVCFFLFHACRLCSVCVHLASTSIAWLLKSWFDFRIHVCLVCFGMQGEKKRSKPSKHSMNTYQYSINHGTNYTDYRHVLRGKLLGYGVGHIIHIRSSM